MPESLRAVLEYAKECLAELARHRRPGITFTIGTPGIYAVAIVAAHKLRDSATRDHYAECLRGVSNGAEINDPATSQELLNGRVGYIYACLFANQYTGIEVVPMATLLAVAHYVIQAGRTGARDFTASKPTGGATAVHVRLPLYYKWHDTPYTGAAHGLAGICHVLLHLPLPSDELNDVLGTIDYLLSIRFPSGNLPSHIGKESDKLIHFCHGAPGLTLTLIKAYRVTGADKYRVAALECGEVVWRRGLLRRVGICHGISGNAYVFLSLARMERTAAALSSESSSSAASAGAMWDARAFAFASFLVGDDSRWRHLIDSGQIAGGDRPTSLFEGTGGLLSLLYDLRRPEHALFPGYELP
jgi:hypothetical protein